ncbi:MAG TPA: 30S ribosomal protein S7 [Patescibacteria group bacterium]|nr:30S ribosomal protein S7 [Patescibacteria group bacterium]
MARGKSHIKKRKIEGDEIYGNLLVAKFINSIMKHGKKSPAQKVFYDAFEIISKKEQNPLEVFENAIQNVGPRQEVKPRRVGGASYQVPQDVRPERRTSLAIRWIIEAARARSNKEFHGFEEKLAAEFMDAAAGTGAAMKKRDTVQRMADANRAFSHFRF